VLHLKDLRERTAGEKAAGSGEKILEELEVRRGGGGTGRLKNSKPEERK
jgi:hypothetical protein